MAEPVSLDAVKAVLPHTDDDLILDVLHQTGQNVERAIDILLQLQLEDVPATPVPIPSKPSTDMKKPAVPVPKSKAPPATNVPSVSVISVASAKAPPVLNLSSQLMPPAPRRLKESTEEEYSDLTSSGYSDLTASQEMSASAWDEDIFILEDATTIKYPVGSSNIDPNEYDKTKSFLAPVEEQMALCCLTPTQAKAVRAVVETSKQESEKLMDQVLKRVKRLGWTDKEFQRALHYIRDEAPIIIHLDVPQIIPFLQKDTHYRNQFETKRSRGTLSEPTRIGWEDRIFSNVYHSFDLTLRDVMNDPMGVRICYSYGDSYLVLKKVRLRTTFATKDTSSVDVRLASCEYYCHVLNDYNDNELTNVMSVANKRNEWCDSSKLATYKEVQIHGPIVLNEHVAQLCVNKRHRGDKSLEKEIQSFCLKNKCTWRWMD